MKINGTDLQSQLSVYQSHQSQRKSPEAAGTVTPLHQDRVALSGRGQMIANAQRAITSIPDVRETLVSRIHSELENGTYVFDNQRAAEGILRESMVNQAAMG
jgi:flagellar biosynthesis anti-sigma factor FlgM